uniref:Uncharacterized protein n=1 Tax=Arundo donax TaxID=35708 RepID=A0A0A9GSY8_ARUDO
MGSTLLCAERFQKELTFKLQPAHFIVTIICSSSVVLFQ